MKDLIELARKSGACLIRSWYDISELKEIQFAPEQLAAFAEAIRAEERATIAASAQDAARLDFMANTPPRYIEEFSGMWRVYQDGALPTRPDHYWIAMTTTYHTSPREAIDAATKEPKP
jgi:hypothetical protein